MRTENKASIIRKPNLMRKMNMACLSPISSNDQMAYEDKQRAVRRNPSRRCKLRAAAVKTFSEVNFRSRPVKQAASTRITRSTEDVHTTAYSRASSHPTEPLTNASWDEIFVTPSAAQMDFSLKLLTKHDLGRNTHTGDSCSDCSQASPRPDKKMKPAATRSKVAKHVHFADNTDDVIISYEVTKDDIKNSWLDTDVSNCVESTRNENPDLEVSFGRPTGHFTSEMDDAMYKNGKEYMVRITQHRLIKEMSGQRAKRLQAVLEEQARKKREGIVDPEEISAVASELSKWAVELAKSSWWLNRT